MINTQVQKFFKIAVVAAVTIAFSLAMVGCSNNSGSSSSSSSSNSSSSSSSSSTTYSADNFKQTDKCVIEV